MTDGNERIDRMESRLDDLTTEVRGLGSRMSRLEVLHEELRGDVRLVAEVQTRHGEAIEEIRERVDAIHRHVAELPPLRAKVTEFIDFARQVLDNHERRVAALEAGGSDGRG